MKNFSKNSTDNVEKIYAFSNASEEISDFHPSSFLDIKSQHYESNVADRFDFYTKVKTETFYPCVSSFSVSHGGVEIGDRTYTDAQYILPKKEEFKSVISTWMDDSKEVILGFTYGEFLSGRVSPYYEDDDMYKGRHFGTSQAQPMSTSGYNEDTTVKIEKENGKVIISIDNIGSYNRFGDSKYELVNPTSYDGKVTHNWVKGIFNGRKKFSDEKNGYQGAYFTHNLLVPTLDPVKQAEKNLQITFGINGYVSSLRMEGDYKIYDFEIVDAVNDNGIEVGNLLYLGKKVGEISKGILDLSEYNIKLDSELGHGELTDREIYDVFINYLLNTFNTNNLNKCLQTISFAFVYDEIENESDNNPNIYNDLYLVTKTDSTNTNLSSGGITVSNMSVGFRSNWITAPVSVILNASGDIDSGEYGSLLSILRVKDTGAPLYSSTPAFSKTYTLDGDGNDGVLSCLTQTPKYRFYSITPNSYNDFNTFAFADLYYYKNNELSKIIDSYDGYCSTAPFVYGVSGTKPIDYDNFDQSKNNRICNNGETLLLTNSNLKYGYSNAKIGMCKEDANSEAFKLSYRCFVSGCNYDNINALEKVYLDKEQPQMIVDVYNQRAAVLESSVNKSWLNDDCKNSASGLGFTPSNCWVINTNWIWPVTPSDFEVYDVSAIQLSAKSPDHRDKFAKYDITDTLKCKFYLTSAEGTKVIDIDKDNPLYVWYYNEYGGIASGAYYGTSAIEINSSNKNIMVGYPSVYSTSAYDGIRFNSVVDDIYVDIDNSRVKWESVVTESFNYNSKIKSFSVNKNETFNKQDFVDNINCRVHFETKVYDSATPTDDTNITDKVKNTCSLQLSKVTTDEDGTNKISLDSLCFYDENNVYYDSKQNIPLEFLCSFKRPKLTGNNPPSTLYFHFELCILNDTFDDNAPAWINTGKISTYPCEIGVWTNEYEYDSKPIYKTPNDDEWYTEQSVNGIPLFNLPSNIDKINLSLCINGSPPLYEGENPIIYNASNEYNWTVTEKSNIQNGEVYRLVRNFEKDKKTFTYYADFICDKIEGLSTEHLVFNNIKIASQIVYNDKDKLYYNNDKFETVEQWITSSDTDGNVWMYVSDEVVDPRFKLASIRIKDELEIFIDNYYITDENNNNESYIGKIVNGSSYITYSPRQEINNPKPIIVKREITNKTDKLSQTRYRYKYDDFTKEYTVETSGPMNWATVGGVYTKKLEKPKVDKKNIDFTITYPNRTNTRENYTYKFAEEINFNFTLSATPNLETSNNEQSNIYEYVNSLGTWEFILVKDEDKNRGLEYDKVESFNLWGEYIKRNGLSPNLSLLKTSSEEGYIGIGEVPQSRKKGGEIFNSTHKYLLRFKTEVAFSFNATISGTTNGQYWEYDYGNVRSDYIRLSDSNCISLLSPCNLSGQVDTRIVNINSPVKFSNTTWPLWDYDCYYLTFDSIDTVYKLKTPQNSLDYPPHSNNYDDLSTFIREEGFEYVGEYGVSLSGAVSGVNGPNDTEFTTIRSEHFFKPNNKILVIEYNQSGLYCRPLTLDSLSLPINYKDVYIPPNEWLTSDNFNRIIDKLEENFQYVINSMNYVESVPNGYLRQLHHYHIDEIEYYGIDTTSLDPYPTEEWDVLGNNLKQMVDSPLKENYIYMLNQNQIYRLDTSGQYIKDPCELIIDMEEVDIRIANKEVVVDAIAVNNEDSIFVLVTNLNKIFVFDENNDKYNLSYTIGGLGGPAVNDKFYKPNDIRFDNNFNLWVSDLNNLCFKQFTSTGAHLKTYMIPHEVIENEKIGNVKRFVVINNEVPLLYVLTDNFVYVLEDGNLINLWALEKTNPIDIMVSPDNYYIYVVWNDEIRKYYKEGVLISKSKLRLREIYKNTTYVITDISTICITKEFEILIKRKDQDSILVYTDPPTYNTVLNPEYKDKLWSLNDIYVDKNENIQDSVVNTSLQRFADNIRIVLHSINGKIKSEYDEYKNVNFKVIDLNLDEIKILDKDIKNTVFVGINEIVSTDVINRCVDKLYDYTKRLLSFIS